MQYVECKNCKSVENCLGCNSLLMASRIVNMKLAMSKHYENGKRVPPDIKYDGLKKISLGRDMPINEIKPSFVWHIDISSDFSDRLCEFYLSRKAIANKLLIGRRYLKYVKINNTLMLYTHCEINKTFLNIEQCDDLVLVGSGYLADVTTKNICYDSEFNIDDHLMWIK